METVHGGVCEQSVLQKRETLNLQQLSYDQPDIDNECYRTSVVGTIAHFTVCFPCRAQGDG